MRVDASIFFVLRLGLWQETVQNETSQDKHETNNVVQGQGSGVLAHDEFKSEANVSQRQHDGTGDVEQSSATVLDDQQQGNVVTNVGNDVHQHSDPNFTAHVTRARIITEQATSAEPQLFGDFVQRHVVRTTEAGNRDDRSSNNAQNELEQGDPSVQIEHVQINLALEGNFLVDTRERVGHGGQEEDDHAEDRVGRVVVQQLRNQRDHNARNDQRGTGVVRPTVAAELMTLAD